MTGERGFVVPEWLVGITLILMPMIVLVASIAPWYQRANMATLMAQEAARTMVLADSWEDGEADARQIALEIATNHGLGADEWCPAPGPGCVAIVFDGTTPGLLQRGTEISVSVEVPIPGVVVPGFGSVAEFQWSQSHVERVDDYRSIVREP
ncbi:MAG: hypothetical protein HKN91_02350 [Acidimicrobiia bacterium]|nr:hypothetical protein [Acidimicrobiia bacterium]